MTTTITATAQQQNIEKAARCPNILENFEELTTYEKDDIKVNIYFKRKGDMEQKTLKWAFKLAETNVGPYYKKCDIGWQPKIKQSDLNKNWARYLVAVDKNKNPIAYAMFRFDLDYGASVLYCYEMHVIDKYQNHGIGSFMMSILEKIGSFWKMEKIVLTVLKNDEGALRFYRRLNYMLDESSPDKSENADYEIYSKMLY